MIQSLQRWFRDLRIDDPIDRKHAYLLQVMMVILMGFSLLTLPFSFLISGTLAEGLRTNLSTILIQIFMVIAFVALRRGHIRQSVLIAAGGLVAGLGVVLAFEGVRRSSWVLSAFMLPLTLTGLLTRRRDVLLIAAASIAVVAGAGALQVLAPQLIGRYPRQGDLLPPTISTFVLSTIMVMLFFQQFSNSLRESLEQTLARERDLRQIRDNLELLVAERTAQLTAINRTLRQDLELAREIQLGLLPGQVPWDARLALAGGQSLPALEVGGDFFTFIAFEDTRYVAAAVGDISGKGVGAALLMALMISAVEAEARVSRQPAAVLAALNQRFYARLKANRMNVALLYLLIDLEEGWLHAANAGLVYPLIIGADGLRTIELGGLPLGSLPVAAYQELAEPLRPGEIVVAQTDGVAEAHDRGGRMFGFERMEAALTAQAPAAGPVQAIATLFQAVAGFTAGAPQHDDITVVAIQPSASQARSPL